ncbi:hypothetical protein K490DRAFT_67398 [Saccharata proteae CBS 121410]|uniref:Uncharacterized protein n=1 Tax=Saccharata proteae CBS 121410 TaxID=1314787 RepID=A0A9P4LTS2_9PEZI|nr:hypothetical protein K490DRAFT_67398 [Saccharata proteae CBS 121410]
MDAQAIIIRQWLAGVGRALLRLLAPLFGRRNSQDEEQGRDGEIPLREIVAVPGAAEAGGPTVTHDSTPVVRRLYGRHGAGNVSTFKLVARPAAPVPQDPVATAPVSNASASEQAQRHAGVEAAASARTTLDRRLDEDDELLIQSLGPPAPSSNPSRSQPPRGTRAIQPHPPFASGPVGRPPRCRLGFRAEFAWMGGGLEEFGSVGYSVL